LALFLIYWICKWRNSSEEEKKGADGKVANGKGK